MKGGVLIRVVWETTSVSIFQLHFNDDHTTQPLCHFQNHIMNFANSLPVAPVSEVMGNPFAFEGSTQIKVSYLGSHELFGTVSAHAMALASPAWKKLIFPSYPSLKSSGSKGDRDVKDISIDDTSCQGSDGMTRDEEGLREQDIKGQNEVEEVEDDTVLSEKDTETQNGMMTPQSESPGTTLGSVGILDFSDDDGEAVLIILCIVHFQFADIPPNPEFKTLLRSLSYVTSTIVFT